MIEDDSVCGGSCSNRTVFLNLSGCSSLAVSDPVFLMWMSLIMFFVVLSFLLARCDRMSIRHLLLIPRYTHSAFFFHSPCLGDSVFVCIHPCFTHQGSLNDRSDSLSAFVIMWLCRSSMRCERRTAWTPSSVSVSYNVRRQDAEPSGFNLWRSFNHNPWKVLSQVALHHHMKTFTK